MKRKQAQFRSAFIVLLSEIPLCEPDTHTQTNRERERERERERKRERDGHDELQPDRLIAFGLYTHTND